MPMFSTSQCALVRFLLPLLLVFSFFCYANSAVEATSVSENEANTHGKINNDLRRIQVDDHDREVQFKAFFSPIFNNPFFKKPLPLINHIPNSFPFVKKPLPIPTLKNPLPFPVFNKPIIHKPIPFIKPIPKPFPLLKKPLHIPLPKSIPIAKPTPKSSSPITKKPQPVPVLKKPVPKSIPIVKSTPKPISQEKNPCPILKPIPFLKHIPKSYSIGKRPLPIPVFKKPILTPIPFFKKPFPIPEKPFFPPIVPDLQTNPFFKNHIPKLPLFPYKFKHPLFPHFPTQKQMTTTP